MVLYFFIADTTEKTDEFSVSCIAQGHSRSQKKNPKTQASFFVSPFIVELNLQYFAVDARSDNSQQHSVVIFAERFGDISGGRRYCPSLYLVLYKATKEHITWRSCMPV
jgi:hypothetical protein